MTPQNQEYPTSGWTFAAKSSGAKGKWETFQPNDLVSRLIPIARWFHKAKNRIIALNSKRLGWGPKQVPHSTKNLFLGYSVQCIHPCTACTFIHKLRMGNNFYLLTCKKGVFSLRNSILRFSAFWKKLWPLLVEFSFRIINIKICPYNDLPNI